MIMLLSRNLYTFLWAYKCVNYAIDELVLVLVVYHPRNYLEAYEILLVDFEWQHFVFCRPREV